MVHTAIEEVDEGLVNPYRKDSDAVVKNPLYGATGHEQEMEWDSLAPDADDGGKCVLILMSGRPECEMLMAILS
jgi:hypothetical protein